MIKLQQAKTHLGHFLHHARVGGINGIGEYFAKLYSRKVHHKPGINIFDRGNEWDLLIILDAARVDAMQELTSEVSFLNNPDTITSTASTSETWMKRTFIDNYQFEMEETAYVCANPFSDELLAESDFRLLDEVWKHGWNNQLGTVPAPEVTDSAIEIGRNRSPDKMIVHYMQPHFPSVPHNNYDSEINLDTFGEGWESIWDDLRAGKVDPSYAWELYFDNLRYVLDEVKILKNNLDAEKVIITADHGNAFGEWWQWGHPKYVKIGVIRHVPWYSTTAIDKKEVDPPREDLVLTSDKDTTVKERLRSLGYTS